MYPASISNHLLSFHWQHFVVGKINIFLMLFCSPPPLLNNIMDVTLCLSAKNITMPSGKSSHSSWSITLRYCHTCRTSAQHCLNPAIAISYIASRQMTANPFDPSNSLYTFNLSAKQNHHHIAIAKLKYEQTNPISADVIFFNLLQFCSCAG